MEKKLLFTNILIFLISTVFSLIALEQSFRIYLFGIDSFSITKMNSINGLGELGLIKPSNNSEIFYELKPNLNSMHKLVEIKTNANGLRDKEYSIAKNSNTFRVAVIGDSFAMPDGVEIENSFHSLLESRLNNEQKDIIYQFINFGVSGYNLRQYLEVIRVKAQLYDPDLILVSFTPRNDQDIPENKLYEQPYQDKPKTYPFFHSFSLDALKGYYNYKNIQEKELTRNAPFSGKQKRYMASIFSEMSAFSKQHDIPIVIIYLDNFYNEKFADKLEEIVVKKDLNFVNASLLFKGKDMDDYMLYPSDGHPNAEAHILFADVLYDYLNQDIGGHKSFLDDRKKSE